MPSENVSERIARLLDAALQRTESFAKEMSWRYPFRPYTFDEPYPLEAEHIYCVGKIYTVRIRTISQELAEFFSSVLPFCGSDCLQILRGTKRANCQMLSGARAYIDTGGGEDTAWVLAQSDAGG